MIPYTPKIEKSGNQQISDTQRKVDDTKYRNMANALRVLAIDAIETARSGHPGLPLGAADIVTILFTQFLKFNPADPCWPDRDRFILSAGHGSMLLYALLHLTGYEAMTMDDIKTFRQLGSRAAGHPECDTSAGIEITTGPLGQGLATAVGMAIAECHLSARFSELVDHYTYVLVSDGDLMEGISHEAASLAGNLKLNKLIVLFDDNGISIDGPIPISDTVDQLERFTSYGWQVTRIDGHDPQAIASAIKQAKNSTQPSLIACKTIIGYGAPGKQGTSSAHGSPLGKKEAQAAKDYLGWTHEPFEIPNSIRDLWRVAGLRNAHDHKAWKMRLDKQDNCIQNTFERRISGNLPSKLDETISMHKSSLINAPKNISTRKASELMLNVINPVLPDMIGGSADLTGSNNTRSKDMKTLSSNDYSGNFIHYGIREHAMAAAMNGMALHGGIIPYSGTFLVFADYCRPAIRLSALMKQRVIYVMTHDSIGLGEDGPTHQPVEHLISLRAIPDLLVMRPCDAVETAECWQIALQNKNGPSLLALSRQNLPQLRIRDNAQNMASKGGYVLTPASRKAQVTLIATGSETHLAVKACEQLEKEGIATTVVSLPCWELFDMQPKDYRNDIIPPYTVRVAIEAGSSLGWERYTGEDGAIISLDKFGASAPHDCLYDYFQITPEAMIAAAKNCLAKQNGYDSKKEEQ